MGNVSADRSSVESFLAEISLNYGQKQTLTHVVVIPLLVTVCRYSLQILWNRKSTEFNRIHFLEGAMASLVESTGMEEGIGRQYRDCSPRC